MEQNQSNLKKIALYILIAVAIGAFIGILTGILNNVAGIQIPPVARGAGVGAAIGITYVLLSRRKSE